jgi:hypothetical protein
MIKRLKHWWKNFQYWRWPPKKKIKNPHYHCCCTSCIEEDEPHVRELAQGLHEVEINTAYSDGDNRVSIMLSVKIPPSSDHLLHTYEFEKSMDLIVAKCLELNEKFRLDKFSIGAFTIEATMVLRGKLVTYPDLSTCPCPNCSGLFTDDVEKPLTLEELNQRFNDLSRIVRTSNKIYELKGILKNE